MRICICDDDHQQCESLKSMILEHSEHEVTIFHSAKQMLFECEHHFPFDCLFLDIQMEGMNGIELAKKIRQIDDNIIIVFITAIKDYVFEGYEVQAWRYLLKPLTKEKCHALLLEINNKIKKQTSYILVNKAKIDCATISYIEVMGHYCSIKGKNTMDVKMSIKELKHLLPANFIQTHRSYLVNMEWIESIAKDKCLLKDDIMVPISRNMYHEVNKSFMSYIKKGMMGCY
ncbi:MAG: LytTR family DNA-binding domain-containing protein [Erysipelotrichaceae bacterium]|nr:LytTR family DNA-binding domain-containing protein [Erysipelotrichaceae bacterium]MDY5251944.1 LytTR family DNA-binding domain-containing protein [Erysipelotrichaceae bacterium]